MNVILADNLHQIGSIPFIKMMYIGKINSKDGETVLSYAKPDPSIRERVPIDTYIARACTWETFLWAIYDTEGPQTCKRFDDLCLENIEWQQTIHEFLGE